MSLLQTKTRSSFVNGRETKRIADSSDSFSEIGVTIERLPFSLERRTTVS